MTTLPTIPASQTVFAMSPDNAPVLRAASGSRVRFETCDCFTDQIQTPADTFDNLDWNRINPATGPLFVEGAEPGDTLRVHIRHPYPAQAWPATGWNAGASTSCRWKTTMLSCSAKCACRSTQ